MAFSTFEIFRSICDPLEARILSGTFRPGSPEFENISFAVQCVLKFQVKFKIRPVMPYTQSQQETLQAGRQQLKAVAQARSCDRVPPKQWSRCNRQDLLEICSLDQQEVCACFSVAVGCMPW